MLVIYLLASLIGGLLVLLTLLMGEHAPGVVHAPGGLFRARLWMMPLVFFGLTGLVLHLVGRDIWLTLGLATLVGVPGGLLSVFLQRLLAGDTQNPAPDVAVPGGADPAERPDRAMDETPAAADAEPAG